MSSLVNYHSRTPLVLPSMIEANDLVWLTSSSNPAMNEGSVF